MNEAAASPTKRQIFKVALASIVGSVIEQYDFLVTGVIAATIWGGIFFKLPGVAAVAAAIGVYGIGIIIRPVGAYIFGNIADRRGRRDALVYALVLMGVSTLLIGLTPTYDSIGVIAPVLLIVFRLLQFRRRVRHRLDMGSRTGGAFEVPRLLGCVGRVRDPDRAAAGFRLGDLRQIADDAGAFCCLGLAHLVRRGFPGGDRRPHHPDAHRGQLCVRTTQGGEQDSRTSRAPGLARNAADHPAHLAGERNVRRCFLPLLRIWHRLHEGGRLHRIGTRDDRVDRRGLHAGIHDHRFAARRHHQPPDDPVDCRQRVPDLRYPVFLPYQHGQLPPRDDRRDHRLRLRVRLRLRRDPDPLYGEFSAPLSRPGRERGLSNRTGLRRRADPNSRRAYPASLRHSQGLYLYRASGDGLRRAGDPRDYRRAGD